MDTKETLLDIYSDGGEWEDLEPIIDEMLSKIAALTTRLQEAEEVIKPIGFWAKYIFQKDTIVKMEMQASDIRRAAAWLKGGTE